MSLKNVFNTGLKYVGLKEVPGFQSNGVILRWIRKFFPQITDDSKCAWCSIFLIELFKECGYSTKGANTAAKSWVNLKGAIEVELKDAQMGDIAIFHRGNGITWRGHVGVIGCSNVEGDIVLLSGNHKNQVTLEAWPTDKLWKIIRPKELQNEII